MRLKLKTFFPWFLWLASVLSLSAYFWLSLQNENETIFIPDDTTHGHYQIELACNVCHTENFEGVDQGACLKCHEEELENAVDSHPDKKFLDPRNADRVEILDARLCITCHREHQPEITEGMGVTLPTDYCYYCHEDVAEERPSHEGMGFDTCASAGCHNYHDNTALYEDFLAKHLDEPAFLDVALLKQTTTYETELSDEELVARALKIADRDAPAEYAENAGLNHDWATTVHAAAGVNCTDCHEVKDPVTQVIDWVEKPSHEICQTCHEHETKGFLEGRHGMRLAQGLSPMKPSMARLKDFHPKSMHEELSCTSCHSSHKFDTRHAAVNACMNCHNDEHTQNYLGSKHYALWLNEINGDGAAGSGVSCATCHLPRMEKTVFSEKITYVEHNQNATLRPNEKMIRPVCTNCHGLGFAIDSLADVDLIKANFSGSPQVRIESLDMVKKKLEEYSKDR